MFKQNKLRTQRQQNGILIYSMCFMLIVITLLVDYVDSHLKLGVTSYINSFCISLILVIFLLQTIIWLIRNKAYKGIRYAIYHYFTVLNLRKFF